MTRFEHDGRIEDLDESVSLYQDALTLAPVGSADRPGTLSNLGRAMKRRFERSGSVEDMSTSIRLHQEALALSPEGHPNRFSSLTNLGGVLQMRFVQSGEVEDLNESIRLHRAAVDLCPEGNLNRASSLNNLAIALLVRFKEEGKAEELEESIQLLQDALSLRPEGHAERPSTLNDIGRTLVTRFERTGWAEDLNGSILLFREALALCPEGNLGRFTYLTNLGGALITRFDRIGGKEDLEESIRLQREALDLLPEGHSRRSLTQNNLAAALQTRFRQAGGIDDLNEAIRLYRDVLALRPVGHTDRSLSLNNLASALHEHARHASNVRELDEGLAFLRESLALLPEGHSNRSPTMRNLATAHYGRFELLGQVEDYEESIRLLKQAAANTFASSLTRLQAAQQWKMYARRHDHGTTLTAYRTALELLQRALTVGHSLNTRHAFLTSSGEFQTLGVDAASYAIEQGDLNVAVELLEEGRAILWSQMRGFRTPLDDLERVNKTLAQRFRAVSHDLEVLLTSSEHSLTNARMGEDIVFDHPKRTQVIGTMMERLRRLSEEQEAIIDEIRTISGFEDFLRTPSFKNLLRAASEGPIIMLNHSVYRSDAVIILSNEEKPCVSVPLDREWFKDSEDLCNDLLRSRYHRGVHSSEYDETLRRAMKVLWDRVVSKVTRELGELGIAKESRIWWCPTRFLALLPFHAAGPYETPDGVRYLLDDYISSYTPTLKSLLVARAGARPASRRPKLLFVGDTKLPSTKKERDCIRKRIRIGKSLLDREASGDSVLSVLRAVEWVHFACHGRLDKDKPFESAFALPGGQLTLLDIAKADLPKAEFAFLSACHTAEQSPKFALDEALHLAAGMQFCGFRSVIGTMWQLLDRDGPLLAEAVYMHLMNDIGEGEPRFKGAAAAVRGAELYLRSQKDWTDDGRAEEIATERWVNLIHIGA